MSATQKPWISPFVAVTFAAVAITGILMLFHVKSPGMHTLHEWVGLIFAIGATFHLLLNWRALVSYFKKSKAIWSIAIGVLVLTLLAFAVPKNEHGSGYHSGITSDRQYERSHQR